MIVTVLEALAEGLAWYAVTHVLSLWFFSWWLNRKLKQRQVRDAERRLGG